MIQWFLKYRPKSLDEVENQDEAKKELKSWIDSWLKGKPDAKAVLLYGPPGVGKTTIAEALAHDYKLEMLEMNASDSRRLQDIKNIAEKAAIYGSIFGTKGKLILLDEIDGINLREDMGAIQGILELIENTKYPIVMTANDPWNQSLRELRNKVKMISLNKLGKYPLRRILKKICQSEKINCDDEALDYIIDTSEGDARYAINMLQGIAEGYGKITLDLVKSLARRKERELDPFETLRDIFWARYAWQAKSAATSSQVDYDMLLRWVSENIPIQYENIEDIWRAYDSLSKASIFLKRAKAGDWDLLSYAYDMMSSGVALAEIEKKKPNWKPKWKKYQFPSYIQQLFKSKEIRDLRDEIIKKISVHSSYDKTINDTFPYFLLFYKKYEKQLKFSPKEKEYIESLNKS
ncbi:replication factor C large subunit [Sulfolobus sp. A20]|uniref:replication factor C large subunit n=1 Tax=Saccharolobus sp. A20 TaxID=1891280 RepID=UPI000845C8DE|nr:replication factor C large subunit [Sulfolobus sp. A20]TRM74190.1 replication factor C large subunit [Sulfolobus sp. E5]TRM74476.1 replication factor C large subunit [Sulfolobus sp. B5]TRM78291.1 replication factor C large subunit [Sulfolobus sp. A20-N-F8]TRM81721.1 replication factor C large subunit [Sulfolobus sp. D5]TRM88058.1 replication factor C large subunit [Sulfolobus sp. C3]TRM99675.1 replication factor C large subunit [Sulfolobus sp. E1]